jgi:hypothetical protein
VHQHLKRAQSSARLVNSPWTTCTRQQEALAPQGLYVNPIGAVDVFPLSSLTVNKRL